MDTPQDLDTLVYDAQMGGRPELTDQQKTSLYDLVCGATRKKMKQRLRHFIYNVPLQYWINQGIFRKVHLGQDGNFHFEASQKTYADEIRTLRQCIAHLI